MEIIGIGIGLIFVGILLYGLLRVIWELIDEFLLPPRISLHPNPNSNWIQYLKISNKIKNVTGCDFGYQYIKGLIQSTSTLYRNEGAPNIIDWSISTKGKSDVVIFTVENGVNSYIVEIPVKIISS